MFAIRDVIVATFLVFVFVNLVKSAKNLVEIVDDSIRTDAFARNIAKCGSSIAEKLLERHKYLCILLPKEPDDVQIKMAKMFDIRVAIVTTSAKSKNEEATDEFFDIVGIDFDTGYFAELENGAPDTERYDPPDLECRENIVVLSRSTMNETIDAVNPPEKNAAQYLVIFSEVVDNQMEAEDMAKSVVDLMWNIRLTEVLIAVPIADRVLIMKSLQYFPNVRCTPEDPEVVSYWHHDSFTSDFAMSKPRFNNCSIYVATGPCPPHVYLDPSDATNSTLCGIEGLMISAISDKHNFTLDVKWIESFLDLIDGNDTAKTSDRSLAIQSMLRSGSADIGICGLFALNSAREHFTTPYDVQALVFVVPRSFANPYDSILRPYHWVVWLTIGAGLAYGKLCMRMNGKRMGFFAVFRLFMGIPSATSQQGFLEHFQLILWILCGYVTTQAYIASLASVLNDPWVRQLRTIEDLMNSNLPIRGPTDFHSFFEDDPRYRRILKRYRNVSTSDYSSIVANRGKSDDGVGRTAVIVSIVEHETWDSKYHLIEEPIAKYPIAMATKPTMPAYKTIDAEIQRLLENGLIRAWKMREISRNDERSIDRDREARVVLSLDEVRGIFLLLVVGATFSAVVFLYEIHAARASDNIKILITGRKGQINGKIRDGKRRRAIIARTRFNGLSYIE